MIRPLNENPTKTSSTGDANTVPRRASGAKAAAAPKSETELQAMFAAEEEGKRRAKK